MEPKFRTELKIPDFGHKTSYACKNMFMGSCFTENIGARMEQLKFPVDINPFGIVYNPESVANSLKTLLNNTVFSQNDLIQHSGLWHSFAHHGRFSSDNIETTLEQINERLISSTSFLKNTDFLFITFGTAWVYSYKKTGKTVANCHKIADTEFIRSRLTVTEIVGMYQQLIDKIRILNPSIQVIFTVSPIRHWKDGAIENQRSKATLLLAIDEICRTFSNNCAYFPAYELVMDELRDYRFYAPDMLHISDVAVDFIWRKFENALIEAESQRCALKVQKIVQATKHRPFNKNTPEFALFLKQIQTQIINLEKEFENIDFTNEKEYFFGIEK